MFGQAVEQVFRWTLLQPAPLSGRTRRFPEGRVGLIAVVQGLRVPGLKPREWGGGQMVLSRSSVFDGGFDVHEEGAHFGRPRLLILFGDELPLAQVVGIAQRMGAGRIGEVWAPC